MREELIKICKELKKWCEKYDKDYCDMGYVRGTTMANIDPEDKDYKETNIYIVEDNKATNTFTGEKYE